MEFNGKLQQLRIGESSTQQRLTEQLYVSRTTISEQKNGKSHPNIRSLKCISRFFSITIDELLSNEKLITLAEVENHSNVNRTHNIISGIIDVLAITLIVLSTYGEPQGSHFYHVDLLLIIHLPSTDVGIYQAIYLLIIGFGIARLAFIFLDRECLCGIISRTSAATGVAAICLFAVAGEPYITILLFLLFTVKIFLLLQQGKTRWSYILKKQALTQLVSELFSIMTVGFLCSGLHR